MAGIYTEDQLHQKSPQELTSLLYAASIDKLEQAITAINRGRFIESNQLLVKCNDILYRLGAGLNYEAGIVADQLEALYNYAAETLIQANIHKDAERVRQVLKVIRSLAEAWQTALSKGPVKPSAAQLTRSRAYDQDKAFHQSKVNLQE